MRPFHPKREFSAPQCIGYAVADTFSKHLQQYSGAIRVRRSITLNENLWGMTPAWEGRAKRKMPTCCN